MIRGVMVQPAAAQSEQAAQESPVAQVRFTYKTHPGENNLVDGVEVKLSDKKVSFWNDSNQTLSLEFKSPDAFYGISKIELAPGARISLSYAGRKTDYSFYFGAAPKKPSGSPGTGTIPPGV